MSLFKKAIAECIGTFVLVFFAVGTAILTGDTLATAIAFGLVIIAMAYSIGRISGCHINPAVSFAMAIARKISWKDFLFYVIAQVLGGLLGAVCLFFLVKILYSAGADGIFAGHLSKTAGSNLIIGYPYLNSHDNDYAVKYFGGVAGALVLECILTFIFVYVIFNATSKKATAPKLAGVIIGLTLTLVHLVGIGLTGTSVNPARSIATAFGNLFFEGDATALSQVWIFIFAPLAGGALAALVYKLLHKDDESAEETDKTSETEAE